MACDLNLIKREPERLRKSQAFPISECTKIAIFQISGTLDSASNRCDGLKFEFNCVTSFKRLFMWRGTFVRYCFYSFHLYVFYQVNLNVSLIFNLKLNCNFVFGIISAYDYFYNTFCNRTERHVQNETQTILKTHRFSIFINTSWLSLKANHFRSRRFI